MKFLEIKDICEKVDLLYLFEYLYVEWDYGMG